MNRHLRSQPSAVEAVRKFLAVAAAFTVLATFAIGDTGAEQERMRAVVDDILRADYEADLATLEAAPNRLGEWLKDPVLAGWTHYWIGFARWRLYVNLSNRPEHDAGDPNAILRQSLESFEAAADGGDAAADAHAAAAAVAGTLVGNLQGGDPAVFQGYVNTYNRHLARAKELDPKNPRVLWAEAGITYWTPPQFGGSQERAVELYRAAAEAARAEAPRPGLAPSWGEAEAHMGLAWTYLYKNEPQPALAKEHAERALQLQPNWFYVKQTLLPAAVAALAS